MARHLALILALLLAVPADAAERRVLGWSYLVVNDSIGEFRDRWQSSYLRGSLFFGRNADRAERRLGDVVEIRLSSQIVTPEQLDAPRLDDRPFAGVLMIEALSHGYLGPFDASVGAGVAAVGPQTGSFRFQRWLHERLRFPLPEPDGREVRDGVYPVVSAELAQELGRGSRVRPFAEVRAGLEDLVRLGVDLAWGAAEPSLSVRDPVTGFRSPGLVDGAGTGWRLMAGADAAWVAESRLIPGEFGPEPLPRGRLRAGAAWNNERLSAFYGFTYLTPEFDGQREGQFLGAFQLMMRF